MFGWDGELPPPTVRTIDEMRPVLADPKCAHEGPLYCMYRDLARSDADWTWLHAHKLRYDLTVIPPGNLCGEWVKTKGHYHPRNPAGVGYPEIYEVLEGRARYLLQSLDLLDIVMIDARAGDLVVIPPGYGHVTINPTTDETLAMANIVSTEFESEYGEYISRRGAAYFALCNGEIRKNARYPRVPPVRSVSPGSGRGGIPSGPLYSLIGDEKALSFLNYPERFSPLFENLLRG